MKLNGYIDHTLLKQNATEADLRRLCAEAKEYQFKTVSINSCWTALCADLLAGSGVGVTTCIGFPLGACSTAAKVAEASQAVKDGTAEIDTVLNVGHFIAGGHRLLQEGHCCSGGSGAGPSGQGDSRVLPA